MEKFGGKTMRAQRGFMFIELLVVVIIIGLLAAIAGPVAGKWIRRSEDMAALASVRQVLAVARLEAIKTSSNTVVVVSANSNNTIHLRSFRDKLNVSTPSASDGNCTQEIGEPTLGDVTLSVRIHFWKQGGTEDSLTDGIRFDTYRTVASPSGDASLTDRIVFLPSGGISPPVDSSSGPATPSGGRGIYFADWQGKNYFRVTVESDLSGKGRVDKYIQGSGYFPPSSANRWSWL